MIRPQLPGYATRCPVSRVSYPHRVSSSRRNAACDSVSKSRCTGANSRYRRATTRSYRSRVNGTKSSPKARAAEAVATQQSARPAYTCHAAARWPAAARWSIPRWISR